MKSPPTTGSSGSSTDSKKVSSHPTGSGIQKSSSARTKKAIKVESRREEKKWQLFFDSAREIGADDDDATVRGRLFDSFAEEGSTKEEAEAEKNSSKDTGEDSEYDVKGLMAQIYKDLHRVAAAQASKAASGGAGTERVALGELSDTDLLLREVSVGVARVIKSALAHLYDPKDPRSSEVWDADEKMARCSLTRDDPSYARYGNLAARQPGWKFLSKLAHSPAFCEAATYLDAPTWQKVSASIDSNAVSLTVFAEEHGLEWWTEPIRLNDLFPPPHDFRKYKPSKPKKITPHKWVVTDKLADIHRPTFDGRTQLNIRNNIYRARAFHAAPPPPHWPVDRPYPEDPTKVHAASLRPCLSCHSHTPCACSFARSPAIRPPLVELRAYGAKGVGVRALERIPAGAILGEYVGEVLPYDYAGDPVYALDFSIPGRGVEEVVATISAKRWGNWTRFVNHSCEASTRFKALVLGGRCRSVVQAVRDIEAFEEVTVDYGEGYWRERRCECGAAGCREGRKEGEGEKGPEEWDVRTVVREE